MSADAGHVPRRIVMCSQLSAKVVLSDRGGLLPPDTMSDVTAAYAVCAAFLTRRSPSLQSLN